MEVSALTHKGMPGLTGPSPLLRLQSDERLIALTRRGQQAAFEVLFSRYQSRLLAFCRHMLGSKEDAEDVLQEVFTAAFNAILADERAINVRPWLYRIARNRSLNHLRRATAIGVDSMDVHFADHGMSTSERVMRRESFRQLLGDVNELPETQRTALLLREIDALSYDQIADAMETTVPSVKSLLVRARISLAEAAEARQLSCDEVRLQLGETAEGLGKLTSPARRHVRGCERCRGFKKQLKANNHALAAIFPVGTLFLAKKLLLAKLGSTASAGSAHVGAGAGATAAGTAGAGAAASAGSAAGGILTAGAGAIATKAVAGLAAAAIVTAGAVEAGHTGRARHHHAPLASAAVAVHAATPEPVVVGTHIQPVTTVVHHRTPLASAHRLSAAAKAAVPVTSNPSTTAPTDPTAVRPTLAPAPKVPVSQVTQVTAETTVLPTTATSDTAAPPAPTAEATDPAASTGGTPSPPAEAAAPPTEAPPTEPVPTPPVEQGTSPGSPPSGGTGGAQEQPAGVTDPEGGE